MTVGSWNISQPDNGVTKLTHYKSWSGTDRPKQIWPKPIYTTITRYSKRAKKSVYIRLKKQNLDAIPRSRKREREAPHPYNMSMLKLRDYKSRVLRTDGPSPAVYVMDNFCNGDWYGGFDNNPATWFDDNDQIKLIGKLREKMLGSDFDLSVALGEGHQTLKMVGDTAISIAKSIHHLKKGDLAGAARSLLEVANRKPIKPYKSMKPFRPTADIVASKWLELQYGWRPLIGDIYDGMAFVSNKLNIPAKKSYRMAIRKTRKGSFVNPQGYLTSAITCDWTAVAQRSLKITVAEPMSNLSALGITNPEVVAWELVPFSFVIDWALPIGPWLSARAALASVVISETMESTVFKAHAGTPKGACIMDHITGAEYRYVAMQRIVRPGGPILPVPKLKTLKQALSVGHCLNGLALLQSVGSGILNKRERNLLNDQKIPLLNFHIK